MWDRKNKVWINYRKDIIACDVQTGMFLSAYLRDGSFNKSYAQYLEIIDLQRYKIVTEFRKVKTALAERSQIPFVFVSCKN